MLKSLFNSLFAQSKPGATSAYEDPYPPRDVPDYLLRTKGKLIDLRQVPVFGELAQKTISEAYTNHYYDRLLTIFEGVSNLRRRCEGRAPIMAEVGVFRGGSAGFTLGALQGLGIQDFEFHLFDTFEGHASEDIDGKFDRVDTHSPGLFGNTSLEGVRATLGDAAGLQFHKGRFADTCGDIDGKLFDYVHLDVDLHLPLVHALDFFSSRIMPGGWLIVDDYGFLTCPGAKTAVDEFLERETNFSSITLLSGQCLLIKS